MCLNFKYASHPVVFTNNIHVFRVKYVCACRTETQLDSISENPQEKM